MNIRLKTVLCASAVAIGLTTGGVKADGLAGAYLAGTNAAMRSDYRAASTYFASALARDPNNRFIKQNAMLSSLSMGDVATALKYAKDLVSDEERNSQLAEMLIFVDHIKLGRFDEASQALKSNQDNYTELFLGLMSGWTELGRGKMSAVIETFDGMSNPPTLKLFGQYHKALALAAVGDFETADTILQGDENGTLRLTRGSLIAHAQIMAELDRKDDALALLNSAISGGQDRELEELRDAVANGTSRYDYITSAQDGVAEVLFTLSSALGGPENQQTSLLYARLAQNIRPDDVETILLTSELLRDQQQFDLAIENYTKVPQDHGLFLNAELGRADALSQADKADAAIEVLRGLTRSHSDNPRVHMSLGDALRGAERYSAARDAYDIAVAMIDKPAVNHWFLFYATGICNERLDNWPRAEMNFRRALELAPDQPLVLNYLGYSLVEQNLNLEEAQEMIETAVAARPDSGFIADSLGWVRFKLGKFESAVEPMERAVELMPDDPVVNDHLGDVYWKVGRKREASFQWRRAISFEPEDNDLKRIRRKLDIGLDALQAEEANTDAQSGVQ
jgi:tetratricopeptide (TPR) repeat protein